jgi:hypothetical protein
MEVEKVAQDRYRLRSHGQVMTCSAAELLAVMDWALLHAKELEAESRAPEPYFYRTDAEEE